MLYLLQNKWSHAAEIGCLSQLIGCQSLKNYRLALSMSHSDRVFGFKTATHFQNRVTIVINWGLFLSV